MPYAEHGYRRAIGEIIMGVVASAILRALLGPYSVLFNLISILSVVLLIDVMPYWSISYLFGWIVGLAVVGPYLMPWWELTLYCVIGASFLFVKIRNKLS